MQKRLYKVRNAFFFETLLERKNNLKIQKVLNNNNNSLVVQNRKNVEREDLYRYVKRFLITAFAGNKSEIKDIKVRVTVLNYLAERVFVLRIFKILRSFNKIFNKLYVIKMDFAKITALLLKNQISAKAFVRQLGKLFENMHKYQHGPFFKFVSVLLNEFRSMLLIDLMHNKNNIQIIGMKVVIAGRLKGKAKAKYKLFKVGTLRQTSYFANIKFSRFAVHTGYGVYGIHLWITYKNTVDLTYAGYNALLYGFKVGQVDAVKNYLIRSAKSAAWRKARDERHAKLFKLHEDRRQAFIQKQKEISAAKKLYWQEVAAKKKLQQSKQEINRLGYARRKGHIPEKNKRANYKGFQSDVTFVKENRKEIQNKKFFKEKIFHPTNKKVESSILKDKKKEKDPKKTKHEKKK